MRSIRYARRAASAALLAMPLCAALHAVQQPSSVAGGGSISGTVVSAATGEPVARARVSLTSGALATPRVVLTDGTGVFRFRALPAGTFALTVTRTGYAPQYFGRTASGTTLAPAIQLAAGQQLAGVALPLALAGVIAGRVLDEDGAPLAGATVEAQARREESPQALATVATAQTDDRGEFRLIGLAAGQYFVRAFDPAFANAGDESGPLRFAPTYHPGVVMPQDARPVTVGPGKEAARIEFKLQFVRPAAVSGRIFTAEGRRLLTGAVIMTGTGNTPTAAVASEDVLLFPDGRFVFQRVPPGRYVLRGRGETEGGGVTLFATFLVAVEGRNVDNVALQLTRGAVVEGSVELLSPRTERVPARSALRVRAPFIDGTSFGDAVTGDVDSGGRFQIRGLMPGAHVIMVEGLVEPWTLERVMVRGQNLTDAPLDVESGEHVRDVRIIVSDAASQVAGIVRDRRGVPMVGATVIACAESARFWTPGNRRLRTIRSGFDGRYEIRGLPAGDYRLIAVAGLDEAETLRHEALQQMVAAASPLTLEPRGARTLDLALMPTPDPTGAAR